MKSVPAIILAAGEGNRIGRPKALLPFGGVTLLEYVLSVCKSAGFDCRIVVIGAYHESILREAFSREVMFIINHRYKMGQTSSIKRALEVLPESADGFLLFPVDMPLATVAECRELLARFEKNPGAIVVLSHNNKRGHPVIFDRVYREAFLSLEDSEPAHKIVRANEQKIVYVETGNSFVLFDIDTEEDYRQALEEMEKRKSG